MQFFVGNVFNISLFFIVGFFLIVLTYAYSRSKSLKSRIGELEQQLSQQEEQCLTCEHELVGLRDQLSGNTVMLEEKKLQLTRLRTECDAHVENAQKLQSEINRLSIEMAEARISLRERESNFKVLNEQFEEQKRSLKEQFQLLANDILESKAKSMQEQGQQSIETILNPFKQSIEMFKKEVNEIHHREALQQGELRKELSSLRELNQKITVEAHQLSTALKGQKKLQGNWGELILENVLERSGLRINVDFKREVTITSEDGKYRPDAIVYLPDDKHLIIDSKVSLNAYVRFINAENEIERATALQDHIKAVSQRIRELGDKQYHRLPGLNSPEIVFMFMPIESAFVEALKADDSLFQQALNNNVLVATPTTLLTSLNIVRQLWRFEEQNKHTLTLASKAETIFKKLNLFLGSFESIKKSLDKAAEAYQKAENQLLNGRGNLVKQVNEFKNLAPAICGDLPSHFVDRADLELPIEEDKCLEESAT